MSPSCAACANLPSHANRALGGTERLLRAGRKLKPCARSTASFTSRAHAIIQSLCWCVEPELALQSDYVSSAGVTSRALTQCIRAQAMRARAAAMGIISKIAVRGACSKINKSKACQTKMHTCIAASITALQQLCDAAVPGRMRDACYMLSVLDNTACIHCSVLSQVIQADLCGGVHRSCCAATQYGHCFSMRTGGDCARDCACCVGGGWKQLHVTNRVSMHKTLAS